MLLMRKSIVRLILVSIFLTMPVFCPVQAATERIQLGNATLEFTIPEIAAYEPAPIECTITGSGEVTVQASAVDSAKYARFFDSAAPHKVAFRIDYLSENERNGSFRITNVGNTIWKTGGYGSVGLGDYSAPHVFLATDLAPGESVERTVSLNYLKPKDGGDGDRFFQIVLYRSDTVLRSSAKTKLDLLIPNCKPGHSETKQIVLDAKPLHDELEEFGHSFVRRQLNGRPLKFTMKLQSPPWADRVVVRLIQDGAMRAVSVPVNVSKESLKLGGTPNPRWTINGKPMFLYSSLPGLRAEDMPKLREQMGGDNIVLLCGHVMDPNDKWIDAARQNGFKVLPMLSYVRLQWVSDVAGKPLMQGAPEEFNIQRVDALDPDFPRVFAEIASKTYENIQDVIYRTADGKVPICLSSEQSYGYPWWAPNLPTRWGGSSEADRAAFRVWLRDKYGTISKLNGKWKTTYRDFEEIDPLPVCTMHPAEYPAPWKEWGPAIEDFDIFRSKIHGEFWSKTVDEIKKLHPEIICGQNVFGGYASETEPIYYGFYDWGVKDYRGKGVNWMARRTGCLPEDMMCYDFIICWNTGAPDAAKTHINFWREHDKDLIIFARPYPKVVLGGDVEIRSHCDLSIGVKGRIIQSYNTSFFPTLKAIYESGGLPGLLNDSYIGSRLNEVQRSEIELFNKEVERAARE
jgi:hypothetical protein